MHLRQKFQYLWFGPLSFNEAKEKCDSTEDSLGVPNGLYLQTIRVQLDVVTKAEQALINVSSK
jgi:hypothetical protein